ncbi:STAS domain-containing protein [Marinobacterium jannaschii]|uniref:STAS domain-containing protein n=1 Tax=Marinobacterium jannaschii TaxID=64970 RepID=UPI00047F0EB2|nr:STAS domain-containing protein [Marinobacterium jannaschii]
MPITSSVASDGRSVNIVVSDRFDYSLHQGFRDSYRGVDQAGARFTVDLSKAQYMDSSALGMILLLKEHAEKIGGEVVLRKPNEAVRKILDIAKFGRFIDIED